MVFRFCKNGLKLACIRFCQNVTISIWLKIYFNFDRGVLLLNVARDDELFLGNSKVFKKYVELGEEQYN